LKITAARVVVTCPGRNFVTLKIETDEGLHGIGDATLNGRELAVASYLADHVVPTLIGRDAARIEDTWQYLYRGAYWRRGPVTMSAIAAVDTALWDIKAKAAGMPLYQLLGGASRAGVMVYGHANGNDIAETVDEVARYIDLGYKAIRAQCGIPGLKSTYGVAKDKMYYEPADAAIPTENVWSTPRYLDHVPVTHLESNHAASRPHAVHLVLRHDHRLAVDVGEEQPPRRGCTIVPAEVRRVREPSREAVGHAHARVRAHQLAQTIPVAAVEALDVACEQRRNVGRVDVRASWAWCRGRGELRSPAVQRRLHTPDRRARELGDLLERVVEHVLEQHARALHRRQREHEMLDGAAECRARRIVRPHAVRSVDESLRVLAHAAPAQEVDAAVVRDAEQPRLDRPRAVERLEAPVRVEQRILHHVLAVGDRARHPRAVAVEARPQVGHGGEEREVARIELAAVGRGRQILRWSDRHR